MDLEVVSFDNYRTAIDVQKKIFPNEDGTINILASLDRNLFIKKTGLFYVDDNVKYYLAKVDGRVVGITGFYDYQSSSDVWLAWFGILPNERNKGYGQELLRKSIELVKNKKYKVFRLYTDSVENAMAIKLYEYFGFVGEKYFAENLSYDCWIYSKSLTDEDVSLWNKKNLNLSYQSELDQMNLNEVNDILKMYDNMFL